MLPTGDVNGADLLIFNAVNGTTDRYIESDFDLNGEVNVGDKIVLIKNTGIYSSVPK